MVQNRVQAGREYSAKARNKKVVFLYKKVVTPKMVFIRVK
jgi:hypothetical protein